MALTLNHRYQDGFLEISLIGKVTADDYRIFGPKIERLIDEHGKLRILVELSDFKGWTFSGLWEDVKFDVKHFNDVEQLAIVGHKTWHKWMTVFCKPFTTAEVRYFEVDEIHDARAWLTDTKFLERDLRRRRRTSAATHRVPISPHGSLLSPGGLRRK